jgi:hypothetical protein
MNSSSALSSVLLPFAEVMIPDLEKHRQERDEFQQNIARFFKTIDKGTQKQLYLLLTLVNLLSYLYNSRGFSKLDYGSRKVFVDKLFHFPVNKVVGGLTGLRALCFFTYYTQESQWKKINYDGPIKK